MKKRTLFMGLVALALLLIPAATALADNGPHGGYSKTTDACAACHRAHTAKGAMLLAAPDEYQLCITCHGAVAGGANTNVLDGVYVNARNANHAYDGQGLDGGGLRAGGFANTIMNTGLTTTAPGSTVVQSKHVVTGGTGTIWGYGAIDGTVAGNPGLAGVKLECSDCHNPHGNSGSNGQATYRILRSRPMVNGTAAPTAVDVPDDTAALGHNYTVNAANTAFDGITSTTAFPNNYFIKYGNKDLSGFCAQCHTKHAAPSGAYAVDSGDTIFKYRHKGSPNHTDCADCHVSHGSSAKAEGFAAQVDYPGGAAHEASSLLRLDNRGVCYQCHGQSFLSPEVAAVTPTSGQANGTVIVTVTGTKFGTSPSTGNVKIGLVALTVTGWSPTSITGTVPAGTVTGLVKVTTSNGLSNRTGPTFTVTP